MFFSKIIDFKIILCQKYVWISNTKKERKVNKKKIMVGSKCHKLEKAVALFMKNHLEISHPNPWMVEGDTGLREPVIGFHNIELGARARLLWAWNRGNGHKEGPFSALGVESGLVHFGHEWMIISMAIFWKHLGNGKSQEYLGLSQGIWIPSRIVRLAQEANISIGKILSEEYDVGSSCNPHEFLTGGMLSAQASLNRLVETILHQAYFGPSFDTKKERLGLK